jgi:hypothetical protein
VHLVEWDPKRIEDNDFALAEEVTLRGGYQEATTDGVALVIMVVQFRRQPQSSIRGPITKVFPQINVGRVTKEITKGPGAILPCSRVPSRVPSLELSREAPHTRGYASDRPHGVA